MHSSTPSTATAVGRCQPSGLHWCFSFCTVAASSLPSPSSPTFHRLLTEGSSCYNWVRLRRGAGRRPSASGRLLVTGDLGRQSKAEEREKQGRRVLGSVTSREADGEAWLAYITNFSVVLCPSNSFPVPKSIFGPEFF
uniref:Uncharacterized protein n=1 Tax=Opuntia streptacantha TaxID=393608 RepID=A0A7C8Z4L1_OPUST